MANLIIGNDFIQFFHEGKSFTAHITRFVTEEKTIYNVFYNCLDSNEEGKCEISTIKNSLPGHFAWHSHTKNLSETFVNAIGTQIEKKKDLILQK